MAPEFRMGESLAEVIDRPPNSIVHEQMAVANSAVELGRDKPWLFLHPVRVARPGLDQGVYVDRIDRQNIDEDDRRYRAQRPPASGSKADPWRVPCRGTRADLPERTSPRRRGRPAQGSEAASVVSGFLGDVARTDFVMTLPRRIARMFSELYALRIFPPPLPVPGFDVSMAWTPRNETDAAIGWLRDQIRLLNWH